MWDRQTQHYDIGEEKKSFIMWDRCHKTLKPVRIVAVLMLNTCFTTPKTSGKSRAGSQPSINRNKKECLVALKFENDRKITSFQFYGQKEAGFKVTYI